MDQPCELCFGDSISTQRIHPYGVELCETCARGLMPDLLEQRGIRLKSTIRTVGASDGPDQSEHVVTASIPSLGGKFAFTQRSLLGNLLELLTRPRRVGDPVFDDNVTASGTPSETLDRALSSDGFQSAVLELAVAASFTVVNGELAWTCERPERDDQLLRDARRSAAVVLHHLEQAART